MGRGKPGLCVVTGPAGCGKSAIAGRIVSLSNKAERKEIARANAIPPAELDPGADSVDAHVQARGMDLAACSQVLADALGVVVAGGRASHNDVVAWAEKCERPPVVVIDGLDEAGDEAERIATELLARLASNALIVVASRDRPAGEEGKTLLGLLGAPALPIDLGEEPEGTDVDLDRYVRARLDGVEAPTAGGAMDPGAVAGAITTLVRETGGPSREGGFLLARVLTSQLRERPVDTTISDWEVGLATSVEQALFQDLEVAEVERPLEHDAEPVPGAGKDLLAALAYSYGPGFPADDVWPAVAAAITDTEVGYERMDAFWALDQYRRYVTASSLEGQAVYRLHQRLAEALRRDRDGAERDLAPTAAAAVLAVYEWFLQSGRRAFEHPYLWHYAWRHAVDGGPEGIEALVRLARLDPALSPDVAHALLALGAAYSGVGRRADAVAPTERAVEIYEVLAEENPAFLNDLASALNNLGNRYSEVGTPEEGPRRWTEVLERLAADPTAGVVLRLRRSRGDHEHDEAIDDLLEAHAIDPGTDLGLTAQLRANARSARKRDPERFDARWNQAVGQPPAWLLLDDDTLQAAADWINTPTWSQSHAVLISNADRFLTDCGETALAELALMSRGDPTVTDHERILQAAREHGIDEIYRPLLILDTVDAWLEIDDLDGSKRYLIEHHDDLTTPAAAETLAQQDALVHHSLVALARDGQTDRAYELLQAPDELPGALAAARREAGLEQLHAIAQLAHATARTDDEQALAAIHVAIALVLTGEDEHATQQTGQLDEPDLDTTPLIHALTDAITHHPDHAPALAALIRQLTSG